MFSLDPAERMHHDWETRSAIDLVKCGAYRYFEHPSTHPWMVRYRRGVSGAIAEWRPGWPDPVDLLDHVHNGGTMVAHNAAFERGMWNTVIRGRLCPHWPPLRIEQMDCTLARCSTLALPAGLDFATKVLGTDARKDADGHKLMLEMSKPKTRTGCPNCGGSGCPECQWCGEVYTWHDDPAKVERLSAYCADDVEAETQVDLKAPHHTERERKVWLMDQRINDRGVKIDRPLVEKMLQVVDYTKLQLDSRIAYLTHGQVQKCTQVARIVEWLNGCGVECESVAKGEQAELLVRADQLDGLPECREVVELRATASKSSTSKLKTMLKCLCSDDRARGQLFYHGTIGGRWAGRLIQPQNLYAIDDETDGDDIRHLIDMVLTDAPAECLHETISMALGPPMTMMAKSLRSTFIADDGKRFVGGDKSNIEGRVNAWLWDETWKIQAFDDYDRGVGPDLYRVAYGESFGVSPQSVSGVQRQTGKVQELSLGYQGAIGAYVKMARNKGIDLRPLASVVAKAVEPELWFAACKAYDKARDKHKLDRATWAAVGLIVKGFRKANGKIVQGWWDLQDAAVEAVSNPRSIIPVARGRIRYLFDRGFLWCCLPSGRLIAYCHPRVHITTEEVEREDGTTFTRTKRSVHYEGYDSETHRWSTFALYGGMQDAHVVSAIARDMLVDDAFAAEDAGYPIVLTIHDELLTEPDIGFGTADELQGLMCKPYPWIDGRLPLAAKTWEGLRY